MMNPRFVHKKDRPWWKKGYKALYSSAFEFHDEGVWEHFIVGKIRNSKVKRKRRMLVGGRR